MRLYTWEELDELVERDPLALRDLAWEFAKQAGRATNEDPGPFEDEE